MPKILLGIKGRVEGRPLLQLMEESIEIVVWVLALAEFATAAVLIFRLRRWCVPGFLGWHRGSRCCSLCTHARRCGLALCCAVASPEGWSCNRDQAMQIH